MEPSRAALYRYGNVSSSSIWYVLSFIEHFRGVKAGDRVLQVRQPQAAGQDCAPS